jgi:hypothetical protein
MFPVAPAVLQRGFQAPDAAASQHSEERWMRLPPRPDQLLTRTR